MSTAICVRLSDEMKERLDSLAALVGRSRNHVIVDHTRRTLATPYVKNSPETWRDCMVPRKWPEAG
jgi:predicted transcriptional regulator